MVAYDEVVVLKPTKEMWNSDPYFDIFGILTSFRPLDKKKLFKLILSE